MNLSLIIQALSALAVFTDQLTPLAHELKTAIESGDDRQVEAFLARIQPLNDQLGSL